RDGSKHWPSARHIHCTKCDAEDEPPALSTHILLRNPGERLLQNVLKLRHDQTNTDQDEHDEASPADEILRQVKQRKQQRSHERKHAEAHHEPRDDKIRPPPRNRWGVLSTGPLRA